MCKPSVAVVVLFIICCLQVINAEYWDAKVAPRVVRTAGMRWANRFTPRKYRKPDTLQTMDYPEQNRLRYQVQNRFGDLVRPR